MLITHHGLSGPAILQISSYWKKAQPIRLTCARRRATARSANPSPRRPTTLRAALQMFFPNRLAESLGRSASAFGAWTNAALGERRPDPRVGDLPAGTEGYAKAEVTVGGVDTDELSARRWRAAKCRAYFSSGKW